MSEHTEADPSPYADVPTPYADVETTLRDEFAGVHSATTVTRCVEAAHYGALEVTGYAHPSLVERIARKHLHVLALVASERG
ncbi:MULTISPECIES: hypothetical protein [Nonomuraea]|uniref:Uncharacterized protein n=3 Tax=Nonomuraea TaxID=83681 RepID=A0A7Y6I6S1_9ACTN|nr:MULTISPECIES: hypothetical protein [Nonomuraea]MBN6050555.1 hypothetical protein [Nonomuraea sp. RK-328]MCP2347424.1 hypothetical protein [Nonomuraea roseoviolacea subsp. carminata]NUW32752.1 hypothetical protein [Nonomuraea montanisoli]NUW44613.1 hypothetical protein [Nonomuraea rhodomycinica]